MVEYPLKWITDNVCVGYAPRATEQLQCIADVGVSAIVNLCAECYDLHEVEKHYNFEVLFLPVVDEDAPDLEQMSEAVNWINLQVTSGKKVLVHCRYGIGRTGSIVLAYLLHIGFSFSKAEEMMEHTPSWPSTNSQKEMVDKYINTLQKRDGHFTASDEGEKRFLGKFFSRLEGVLKWDD